MTIKVNARHSAAYRWLGTMLKTELDAWAARGREPWHEVNRFIAEEKTDAYEQAAQLLRKLRDLADEQGQFQQFQRRIDRVRSEHSRRPALIRALRDV